MATYEIYSGIVSSGINLVGGYYSTTPMYIYSGGIASHTTVGSDGRMTIYAGGSADNTWVNYSGFMFISSGATATNITANPGARIEITVAPDTHIQGIYAGSAFEVKNAYISGYTIYSGNYMHVCSGGSADNTTLSRGGMMYCYSDGYLNELIVEGYLSVSGGCFASNITINSGGTAYLLGVTSNVTVMSGGSMWQGGTASDVVLASGGYLRVGGSVSGLDFTPGAGRLIIAGDDELGVNIDFNSEMTGCLLLDDNTGNIISSGSEISDITVSKYNQSSTLMVFNGGVAKNITISNQYRQYVGVAVFDGGVASSLTVSSGGQARILSGGSVLEANVKQWGMLLIEQGGYASNVNLDWRGGIGMMIAPGTYIAGTSDGNKFEMNNGYLNGFSANGYTNLTVVSGGEAVNCSIECATMNVKGGTVRNISLYSSGSIDVNKGVATSLYFGSGASGWIGSEGIADNTSIYKGRMEVYGGGSVTHTTVSYGSFYIYSGGTANNTTLTGDYYSRGYMYIYADGKANDTTVKSGGYMCISSGGVHRGSLQIESGATVSAYSGAIIDFTVADRKTEDGYLINDLSLIQGTPTYTVTVSAEQELGTYKLAQGASSFNKTVSIGDGTVNYGSITVNGEDFVYNGVNYSLDQTNGNLTLTIEKYLDITPPTLTISGNTTAPTNQNVVLSISANENCTILYNINNGEWLTYSGGITVTANGTVNIKATDEAGNISEKSVIIDKIDKIAPNKPTTSADITTATNQNVTVSAVFSSDSVVKQYSFDNKTWKTYSSSVVMEDNGTVYFRSQDEAGNYSAVTSYTVSNIDKVAPTLSISGNATAPTNKDVVLTATVSDGVVEYFANGKWNKGNTITASENGTFKFRVTDAAGNVTEKSVTVDMIDKVAPTLEINGNAEVPTNKDVVLTA
ncbi:MAG: AIDA repeat-containing protein, partial [Lentisphaeria bacterium]|nr:AIDA repeat-containing protein [Lentisphaeria bacterium]